MNKIIKVIAVLVVALTSTVQLAKAQSIPFLMYGVTAGLNSASFKLTNTDLSETSQFGYQVGGMIGLDLPIIELTAEALWVHNKMKFNDFDSVDVTSNSIELPILVSVPVLGPIRLKAGPSFTLYNNAKCNYADGFDDLDRVKSTIGYVAGLGVNLFNITVDLRYNGQFTNRESLFGIENVQSTYDIKSTSFSLNVGYRF